MNVALPFAERMLGDHGGFHPYAMAMKPDGEIISVAGYGGREHPPSQEIIDLLTQALRRDAASPRTPAMIGSGVSQNQPEANRRSVVAGFSTDESAREMAELVQTYGKLE
jgi:hypothetical protein